MKYLIVGLGNIGEEYSNTRHNIGFVVLDAFAKASNLFFTEKRFGFIAEFKFKGKMYIFLKPNTYMNLSGKAVNYWLQKEKISIENLLVIVDDLALPFGSIRIKENGGAGGHNGLLNINETLGTQQYARLRFGIGDEFSKGKQVNYVLGEWTIEEKQKLEERVSLIIDSIKSFGSIGIARTMNFFNNK